MATYMHKSYPDCKYSLLALLVEEAHCTHKEGRDKTISKERGDERKIYQIMIVNIPKDLVGEEYLDSK